MKTCSCGAANAGFATACIRCGRDLGESEFEQPLKAIAKLKQFNRIHDSRGLWGSMMSHMVPNQENVEPQLRDRLRRECGLFYSHWAAEIGKSFSRQDFDDYVRMQMADSVPLWQVHEACQQLMHVVESRAGIRRRYEENLAQERAKRQRELAEREAQAARERAEWEQRERIAAMEREREERVRREAPSQARQACLRLLTLAEEDLRNLERTTAELENSGLDPSLLEEELSVTQQRKSEVEAQIVRMRRILAEMG